MLCNAMFCCVILCDVVLSRPRGGIPRTDNLGSGGRGQQDAFCRVCRGREVEGARRDNWDTRDNLGSGGRGMQGVWCVCRGREAG
eukprot:717313-Pyramimonas_sp.AAC.1